MHHEMLCIPALPKVLLPTGCTQAKLLTIYKLLLVGKLVAKPNQLASEWQGLEGTSRGHPVELPSDMVLNGMMGPRSVEAPSYCSSGVEVRAMEID